VSAITAVRHTVGYFRTGGKDVLARFENATYNLLRDNGIDLSYAAFLESWVAVSEALDHWSQRMERAYAMEQVAAHFLSRVCPHHRSHTLPTQLWMSSVKEWTTLRPAVSLRCRADALPPPACVASASGSSRNLACSMRDTRVQRGATISSGHAHTSVAMASTQRR
jgi:hypothetical protein